MSPETSTAKNNTVTYMLGVIVVLLVAIVAIVIIRSQGSANVPVVSGNAQDAQSPPATTPSTGQEPPFDAAKATKVPANETPQAYVTRYYASVAAKKWDEAYKMLPVGKQSFYGNAAALQSSQASYGVKSSKIVDSSVQGDNATVQVEQDLGTNGVWVGVWTFVKNGSTWLVKDRTTSPKQ